MRGGRLMGRARLAWLVRRAGAVILIGALVVGGSAGAAWVVNAHRTDIVSQELAGMMQKLTTDDRVRYFGDNIISWGIDRQDEILRVGVANPNTITVAAKEWLGPRAFYYRATIPDRYGADALRTNLIAVEVQLGCALSNFITVPLYSGNSPEAALRAVTWFGVEGRGFAEYERWTGGPVTEVYTEPAPVTYLAFTAGDHLGLGIATVSGSGTNFAATAWACSSNPRVSVIASDASSGTSVSTS